VSTLYEWKKQLLEHKELLLGVVESMKTDITEFFHKYFDSEEATGSLQRFFSKYGFSFLQNKRRATQSVLP